MKNSLRRSFLFLSLPVLFLLPALLSLPGFAQAGGGTLRGTVEDPTGAVISGATVTAKSAAGQSATATSNGQGAYQFTNLPAGAYTLTFTAPGFTSSERKDVALAAGKVLNLDMKLDIQVEQQQVMVESEAPLVDVSPESNASTMVLKGKDLDALSDDPDELQSELEALAGPAAGPNGGQIYIDGFTGGQLPPKASIREIRINQNPFSPEFDRLGYGRIEVFTKPGTDKLHGQVSFNFNDNVLNTKTPFTPANEPGYHTDQFSANVGGPINKKASYFFSLERRNIGDLEIVNATVLDSNFNPTTLSQAVTNPRVRTNVSPRLDYQLGKNDTITLRYQYTVNHETNDGIGQFSLPSLGYNVSNTEHTVQFSDTHTFRSDLISELRFQFQRQENSSTSQNFTPTINVIQSFVSGGNPLGISSDDENHFELQNYTQWMHTTHSFKFGGRLRVNQVNNTSSGSFNGEFTFGSLAAFQTTERGLGQGLTMAQIQALGGGPTQFSIIEGTPLINLTYTDAGIYASDDWKLRPNFTLSYGLRFETQNYIHDHGDWAPRVAIAWGVGSSKGTPKTVIRAGSGIFYDRFSQGNIENALRLNGATEQEFIVQNPSFFPNIPSAATLAATAGNALTVYQIAPNLRAPYVIQSAAAVERQLNKNSTLSVTYLNSRGVHEFFSDNVNAPIPGAGVRPLGNVGNIYQYLSDAIFKQNQLIVNSAYRLGQRASMTGIYTLNYANSDSSGAGYFPQNQFDAALDYGRAAFDTRHRFTLIGSLAGPLGLRFSPFLNASSGTPYNILLGQDLNGDSIVNDRPSFAPGVTGVPLCPAPGATFCASPFGVLNLKPGPNAVPIPAFLGTGSAQLNLSMRVSKSFGFGPERAGGNNQQGNRGGDGGPRGGGPGGGRPGGGLGGGLGGPRGGGFGGALAGNTNRRYTLTISANATNMLNVVNLGVPNGNLGSPLFGRSNTIQGFGFGGPGSQAANRRITLQALFAF